MNAPIDSHRRRIVLLPPNRVWRTYRGGRTLDQLAGITPAADSSFPEDWVASTTRAVNVGRESIREGVSTVWIDGQPHDFAQLIRSDPEYFLGAAHVARYGSDLRLLVKLLDSSIRLHFQVHPTAAFAQRFLGSPSGKTEAYYVLATRPEVAEPSIYMGFQRPPTRDELRRMIATQDIAAIEACFDRVPVRPGDAFLVPGGMPHALGEGVFLVEIQEPTDWVVRFEFERGGYLLPETARFMSRGLDFCLDVFDLTPHSPPPPIRAPREGLQTLIGPAQTPCFRVDQRTVDSDTVLHHDRACVIIVTEGTLTVQADGAPQRLQTYDKLFVPAGLGPLRLSPQPHAVLLECHPPL